MRQRVNLYRPPLRRERQRFGFAAMAAVLAVVVVGLAATSGWSWWRLDQQRQRLAAEEAAREAVASRLAELERRYPPPQPDARLAAQVRRLARRLDWLQALERTLSQGALGNTEGFSPYLVAFARRHVPGTWLSGLRIDAGGAALVFAGHATVPALVPGYVEQLATDPVLAGHVFNHLELRRPADDAGWVDFTVATDRSALAEADGR